jgi:hypothetical protein
MLLDLIHYFAKYPSKSGVLELFSRGESNIPGYADLLAYMNALPETSVMPKLTRFVIAADLKSTKDFLSKFVGLDQYLMLDYGEISTILDRNNCLQDTFSLAVTVARRLPDNTDLIEQAMASVETLDSLNQLRAHILADQDNGLIIPPVNELISGNHQLVPFEAPELQSVGWTLTFTLDATDGMRASDLKLIYRKQ